MELSPFTWLRYRAAQGDGERSTTRADAVVGEVREDGLVGLPAVRELDEVLEVHRLGGGMGVQEFGDTTPADHNAGLTVPRGQHAQPSGSQMERGRVDPTR